MGDGVDAWWRGGVLYEIYVRSFADSNGDGVGDLEGVARRIPYLVDLGVDALWLTPFFPSPMRDFGYDVADYRAVDPLFGDLDAFRRLLDTAHAHDLKVVIDQVWSHTSSDHAWFQASRSSREHDKADWYVWADAKPDGTPPNNWLSLFGGPAWTWDTRRRQYYLHNFLKEQPDLNFHNPAVQDAILDTAHFWFALGVDGFRLDVCNLYFHDVSLADNPVHPPGRASANPHNWQYHRHCRSQPENLEFFKRLRRLADASGGKALLGEIIDDGGPEVLLDYTAGDDRLHMAYSFDLLREPCDAAFFKDTLRAFYAPNKGWPCWAIGNHDAVRVATRWGDDPPQLRLFAALQMTLRGTPCLYQGEELGLPQTTLAYDQIVDPVGLAMWPDDPGRDGCRTPMPWSAAAPSAGFSDSASPWLPIPPEHRALNAEAQLHDRDSLRTFYKRLLLWRRGHRSLIVGDVDLLESGPTVLAFRRSDGHEALMCVFNLSADPVVVEVEAAVPEAEAGAAASVISTALCADVTRDGARLRLGGWAFAVLATAA